MSKLLPFEVNTKGLCNLMVNIDRLMFDIKEMSKIGRQPSGGVTRRAFDKEDLKARAWLENQIVSAGLELNVDPVGNIFGRICREGPAVICGSHIDTIINGGPLDGSLGVLSALECLRVIKEHNLSVNVPVEMVAFSDEEERFTFGLGSRIFTGQLNRNQASKLHDLNNISLGEAMSNANMNIDDIEGAMRNPRSIKAFVELHIEQGPQLESDGISIGVVDSVLGNYRFSIEICGQRDHAGNPMQFRQDPTLAAVNLIETEYIYSQEISSNEKMHFTVGILKAIPGISNVIPEKVLFTIDYRHAESYLLRKIEKHLRSTLEEVETKMSVHGKITCIEKTEPLKFSTEVCNIVVDAAEDLNIAWRKMYSGAGHDAQIVGRLIPTAMIFVPSIGGRSHCKNEHTDKKDIENGANVLLKTILKLAQ